MRAFRRKDKINYGFVSSIDKRKIHGVSIENMEDLEGRVRRELLRASDGACAAQLTCDHRTHGDDHWTATQI